MISNDELTSIHWIRFAAMPYMCFTMLQVHFSQDHQNYTTNYIINTHTHTNIPGKHRSNTTKNKSHNLYLYKIHNQTNSQFHSMELIKIDLTITSNFTTQLLQKHNIPKNHKHTFYVVAFSVLLTPSSAYLLSLSVAPLLLYLLDNVLCVCVCV